MQLTFSFKRKSLEDVIIARCASICRRAGRVMSNIIETRQRKLKGENCTNLRPHHQNLTTDETTLETHNIDRRNKKWQDRTGHLNLTFQVTCDWQLSQFLRCFNIETWKTSVQNNFRLHLFHGRIWMKYNVLEESRMSSAAL